MNFELFCETALAGRISYVQGAERVKHEFCAADYHTGRYQTRKRLLRPRFVFTGQISMAGVLLISRAGPRMDPS